MPLQLRSLMAEEALIAGRPQVVAPLYLEHLLTVRALTAIGSGALLKTTSGLSENVALLTSSVAAVSLASAARRFSDQYWRSPPHRQHLAEELVRKLGSDGTDPCRG